MTKKRLIVVGGLLAILAVAGLVIVLMPPDDRPGVTKANLDRIKVGMSRGEVESIFGGPPPKQWFGYIETSKQFGEIWEGSGREVAIISFDRWDHPFERWGRRREEDVVTGTEWRTFNESILQKLRRWMHLP